MTAIGTPRTRTATKLLLLGSGELSKEVAIEAQRYGVEVVAIDRYEDAPAMQVAHGSYVLPMTAGAKLRRVIEAEKPDFVVPEIGAIATDTLVELENEGVTVIPTARAARLTMDREGMRRLATEELSIRTSPHRFDYEITLLTVRHAGGTFFCEPIGHRQVAGEYVESWQPQPMSEAARAEAERIARAITDALGGRGVFGVELFVKEDDVWFSQVSPRPHDTGLVTLISQDLSEFALHVRAIVGLPIPEPLRQHGPSASAIIVAEGESHGPVFENVEQALVQPDTELRLFGKPEVSGHQRLGVALARGASIEEARAKAKQAADAVRVRL